MVGAIDVASVLGLCLVFSVSVSVVVEWEGLSWSYAWTDECLVGHSVSGSVRGLGCVAFAAMMLGIVVANSYLVAAEVLHGGALSAVSIVDCLFVSCGAGVN